MNIRVVQLIAGLICSLFFVAFTLYRVQIRSVAATLANANLMWIAAAMVAYAANLLVRAWRWQIIVRPVAVIPYPAVARALLVGSN
jgi:uncharacterized membrane protein YbhN (UPF0104 family)